MPKINDQRSLIMKALSDPYVLKILAYSYYSPKSIPEMSLKLDIPIASCYRKVKLLEKLGLIEKVGTKLTIEGKRVALYRSKLSQMAIEMRGSRVIIRLKVDESIVKYDLNLI
ncbi:MAG: helix-turn-helix transcriptional regulator [Deltaproteobacteria bacterium]|nr:helix-turn-helix transcriptional regulator [Deltaproteobacteria bacterium]MCD6158800.1 helix-turn-helix transcriptional regulator [Euryarchaeota archaeon]